MWVYFWDRMFSQHLTFGKYHIFRGILLRALKIHFSIYVRSPTATGTTSYFRSIFDPWKTYQAGPILHVKIDESIICESTVKKFCCKCQKWIGNSSTWRHLQKNKSNSMSPTLPLLKGTDWAVVSGLNQWQWMYLSTLMPYSSSSNIFWKIPSLSLSSFEHSPGTNIPAE